VLGEFDRKAVERALVHARDEAFHHLLGHELEMAELGKALFFDLGGQGEKEMLPIRKEMDPFQ
jgi:hypothetical protein